MVDLPKLEMKRSWLVLRRCRFRGGGLAHRRLSGGRIHTHSLPSTPTSRRSAHILESHDTADARKQSVVGSETHVMPRMKVRSILTDQDFAGVHQLAAVSLNTKSLTFGIATVIR